MHGVMKILLGPLLVWQGMRVKQTTPRLPEAEGPRAGRVTGGDRFLRLLVLGDSAAAGVGVEEQADCLAAQIPKALAATYTTDWQLVAQSGLTTAEMVKQLGAMDGRAVDLAVISLGVNDVNAGVGIEMWMARQKEMVAMLREKFSAEQIIVTAVPPMDKFPALPWPLNRYLGDRAELMNQALSPWLAGQRDCTFLRIDIPFAPGLMAGDGFHPGPALHRIWAEQAAAKVRRDLGQPVSEAAVP